MENKFNINSGFTIEVTGAWKETTSIIFCDYTRSVEITQDGNTFTGRAGYCGRDKTKSEMKYLFVGDRIYFLDDMTKVFFPSTLYSEDFPKWLVM